MNTTHAAAVAAAVIAAPACRDRPVMTNSFPAAAFPPGTVLHNPVTSEWGRLLSSDDDKRVSSRLGGEVAA
jgi:hypothetical protein